MTRYILIVHILVKIFKNDKELLDKAVIDLNETHLPESIQKYLDLKIKNKWEDIKFELRKI